jgi:hypothetical protein
VRDAARGPPHSVQMRSQSGQHDPEVVLAALQKHLD